MSAHRAPSPAEELAALRLSYARSLPERLGHIREALHAWVRDPSNGEPVARAESLAHRLRGTSGSYGFGAFSEKLGAVEDAIHRLRAAGALPPEVMAVIEPDLDAAKGLAAEVVAGLVAASG